MKFSNFVQLACFYGRCQLYKVAACNIWPNTNYFCCYRQWNVRDIEGIAVFCTKGNLIRSNDGVFSLIIIPVNINRIPEAFE